MRNFGFSVCAIVLTCTPPNASAGDVTATVQQGSLKLVDSADDDGVSIDRAGLGPQSLRLTPTAGTTVNGSATPLIVNGVKKDLRIRHSAGLDSFWVVGPLTIAKNVRLESGDTGACGLVLGPDVEIGKDIRMTVGDAPANLSTQSGQNVVHRDIRVDAKATGGITTVLEDITIGRDLRVRGSSGTDIVTIETDVVCEGDVWCDLGDGVNQFSDDASAQYRRDIHLDGGDGANSLITYGDVDGDVVVSFGAGDGNTVRILGNLDGVLRARSQGDEAEFEIDPSTPTTIAALEIVGGDGEDLVSLGSTLLVKGPLELDLGDGTNTLVGTLASTAPNAPFSYRGGSGTDAILFGAAVFGGPALFDLGAGLGDDPDAIGFVGATFQKSLTLRGAIGEHQAGLNGVQVTGKTIVEFGTGESLLNLTACQFGSLRVLTSTNDDVINLVGTTSIQGDVELLLGAGTNQVAIATLLCGGDFTMITGAGNDTLAVTAWTIDGTTTLDLGGGVNTGP